jgi:DNA-binding NtrC family response regulator
MGNILVVQEDGQFQDAFGGEFSIVAVSGAAGVRAALERRSFDAVLIAEAGAGQEVGGIVAAVHSADAAITVVVTGGRVPPEQAAKLGTGTCEMLRAPVDVEVLRGALRRAIWQTRILRENRALKEQIEHMQGREAENEAAAVIVDAVTPHNGHRPELQWIDSLPARLDLRELLGAVEKSVIQRTLAATQGAQAEAARRLGLSRSDLSYKLSKYELRMPR